MISLFSAFIGAVYIPPLTVMRVVLAQIPFAGHIFAAGTTNIQREIIIDLRGPHIIGAIIIGAVLGVGGATIQSVFKNPITEPYMIGISSGAALGAVLSIALGVTIFGFYTLQTLAFVFSVAIVLAIYVFSLRSRRVPVLYLLLTGIAVSVFISSIVAFLLYLIEKEYFLVYVQEGIGLIHYYYICPLMHGSGKHNYPFLSSA